LPRSLEAAHKKTMGTYHYPDPISPYPLRCYCVEIPDAPEYRRAFLDSIMQLTRWFNYRADPNMSAKQAADYMASVILPQVENDMSCCCDAQTSLTIQTNALINAQINAEINSRFDGSDPRTINPNAPADKFDGDASSARQAALCMALKNYFTQYLNDAMNQAFVGGFIIGALFATGLVLALTGIGFIAGLVIISDLAALGAFVNAYDLSEMTSFVREVACCANAALVGQPITRANWAACLDGCTFGGGADDLTALLKSGLAANFESFINVLGQAYLAAQAGVEDCDCCSAFDLTFDWYNQVDDLTGWTVITTGDFDPALETTLNDAAGDYTAELHVNADGFNHDFVFPIAGGFTTGHRATGMSFDVSNADCHLIVFEVSAANDPAGGDANSKLWVHTDAGWHFVALLDFTSHTTRATLSANIDEVGVDKVAIINYAAVNIYMDTLNLIFN